MRTPPRNPDVLPENATARRIITDAARYVSDGVIDDREFGELEARVAEISQNEEAAYLSFNAFAREVMDGNIVFANDVDGQFRQLMTTQLQSADRRSFNQFVADLDRSQRLFASSGSGTVA